MAGYTPLKYLITGKPLITPEPQIGKFQNWVEMKANWPENFQDGQNQTHIDVRLSGYNFRKIRPSRASEFELTHRRQNVTESNRQ